MIDQDLILVSGAQRRIITGGRPLGPPAAGYCVAGRRKGGAVEQSPSGNRRTPMIGNRISAIALAVASVTFFSTPLAIASPFDGNWSVVAQTT
jgi:hypothetical protein